MRSPSRRYAIDRARRRIAIARTAFSIALAIAMLSAAAAAVWSAGAVYFAGPGSIAMRAALSIGAFAAGAAIVVALASRRWRMEGFVALCVGLMFFGAWWGTVEPSNDRDWQPEVAMPPRAKIAGDVVTVYNIRNFAYGTEDAITAQYYDRSFDLRELDRIELISARWMGPAVAHVFVSFGFGNDQLAISIEARKERSETYSTLRGLFRQYELIYIVGDARDLMRVRTNDRRDPPEDFYLYRAHRPGEYGRRLFLEYMQAINSLAERPKFYNTLTSNYTHAMFVHTRVDPDHLLASWKVLLPGFATDYVYDIGKLDRGLPFAESRLSSGIDDAAPVADQPPGLSRPIRAALPAGDAR